VEATGDRHSVVLVRARSWLCAFRVEDAIEMMRPLPVQSVVGAPAFVRGLAIVRGMPLPVLDLAAILGAETTDCAGKFLAVRAGPSPVVLAVDEVVGISHLSLSSLQDVPLLREALPDHVQKLGVLDGHLLAVLETARLLPDDLRQALARQGIQ
jgi:purine-binding chemotaxis protein CheW